MRTLGTRKAMARSSARPGDAAEAQAGLQFHLELGDDRPGLNFDHANVEAEIGERLFQDFRLAADLFFLLVEGKRLARQQQVDVGQFVIVGFRLGVGRFELLDELLALGVAGPGDPQGTKRPAAAVVGRRRFLFRVLCGFGLRLVFLVVRRLRHAGAADDAHRMSTLFVFFGVVVVEV